MYTSNFIPHTFEEDKFAVSPLVGGVDARWQAFPELIDLHGVALLHLVVPETPKPPVLKKPHNSSLQSAVLKRQQRPELHN